MTMSSYDTLKCLIEVQEVMNKTEDLMNTIEVNIIVFKSLVSSYSVFVAELCKRDIITEYKEHKDNNYIVKYEFRGICILDRFFDQMDNDVEEKSGHQVWITVNHQILLLQRNGYKLPSGEKHWSTEITVLTLDDLFENFLPPTELSVSLQEIIKNSIKSPGDKK